MSALEPCPFCGGRAVIERWMPLGDGRIYCESCVTSRTFRPRVDDATATAAWNRRHVPEGFVLVPVEPTEAMRDAVQQFRPRDFTLTEAYRAMLAAAAKETQG